MLASLGPDEPATVVDLRRGGACPPPTRPASTAWPCGGASPRPSQGFAHPTSPPASPPRPGPSAIRLPLATARRRIVVATDLTASAWRLDAPAPMVPTPAGPVRPEVVAPRRGPRGAAAQPLGRRARGRAGAGGGAATATGSASPLNGEGVEAARDVPAPAAGRRRQGRAHRGASLLDLPARGRTRKALAHDFAAGGPAVVTVALPARRARPTTTRSLWPWACPRDVKALVVDGAPSPVRHRDEAFFVEAALAGPASPVRPTVVDAEAFAKARPRRLRRGAAAQRARRRAEGGRARGLRLERGRPLRRHGRPGRPGRLQRRARRAAPAAPLHLVKTAAERGDAGAEAQGGAARRDRLGPPGAAVFTGEAREGLERCGPSATCCSSRARRTAGRRVLARYDDGAPALVEARRGRGRVMLYTSTVDRGVDRLAHPHQLPARHAAHRRAGWPAALDERRVGARRGGRAATAPLPAGPRLAALVGPDGRERREVAARAATAAARASPVLRRDRPGLWQVKVRTAPPAATARSGPRLRGLARPARVGHPRGSSRPSSPPGSAGEAHARVAARRQAAGARQRAALVGLLLLAVARLPRRRACSLALSRAVIMRRRR